MFKRVNYPIVTNVWTEQELKGLPEKFIIYRVRAVVDSGPATQVALSVRYVSNPTTILDIPLEYTLGSVPLDSGEEILIIPRRISKVLSQQSLFIAVRTNSGSPSSVTIQIEYEEA